MGRRARGGSPCAGDVLNAPTPEHDPADLAKLIGLLAQHEQSFHKGKPFDLKRAIAVVEDLAEAREELWNHIGIAEGVTNAVYQTPEGLA